MACTVGINSVVGVPAGPPANPGSISAITITGTATNTPFVNVLCQCFGNIGFVQVPVANGQWQITGAVPRLSPKAYLCNCGEAVSVIAEATDPSDGKSCRTTWPNGVSCPSCPVITIDSPVVGECVAEARPVTLTVNVTLPGGVTSVLEWDFGDPSPDNGGAFVIGPGPGSNTTTHNYSPGTYTATLRTISPEGCPNITVMVTVDSCTCPQIQDITFIDRPCDAQGNRLVTATVVGGPAGTILWQWIGIDPQAVPGGTSYSKSLPGGTTNTLVVSIQAGSCAQQLPKSHTLQPCEGPPPCPSVTSVTATPASGAAPLAVTFQAVVANPGAVVGGFQWNFGDGSSVNTPNPTASHTFSSPGAFSVSVTVNGATGCSPSTITTTVTVSSGGGGGDGGGCKLLCKILCDILLILALVLLAWASIAAVVVACSGTPAPQAIVVIVILVLVGLGLLILWGFLCARFFCKLLNALSWIISFISVGTFVVGVVLAIYTWYTGNKSLCFLGWFADAGIWSVAAAVVGWISKITGCKIFQ